MQASVNNNVSVLFIVKCIKVLIGEPIQEKSIYGKFLICAQFLWKPKTAFKNKVYFFLKCLSLTLPLMEDVGRGSSFWADRIRHSSAPSVCMGRGEPSGSRRAGV